MEEKDRKVSHSLEMKNRRNVFLTGVTEILSFDEKEILLLTVEGKLMLKGLQLHVKGLDLEKGEAVLEGHVDSLIYLSKESGKKEESLLKRMFR